jgi:ABC-2 type transport system ATP-binding protein
MNILECKNLTKKYEDFTAVDGVDFSIGEGEVFGLLGPNGAGKTTTINMLIGLAKITSGSVTMAGFDYSRGVKKAQHLIGIVPDESNLYEELDGFHNLSFCAALYGMPKQRREKRAKELLEQFDLANTGRKPFKSYSKGMKRKLTMAAGIIHEPRILFLDEPTTGIDVASARQIRQLILDLNKRGTTILLTTHYIEEAERLCHRIAFLVAGRIVRIGTMNELMKEAQQGTIVQFKLDNGGPGLDKVISKEFTELNAEMAGDDVIRIHSLVPINLTPLMRFFDQNNVPVYEAKIIRPSLEDVFVKVTGIEIVKMKQDKEKGKG